MCGVIGYIGKRVAKDLIFKGLKNLEYRGYDSSGIALIHKNKFQVEKEKGKLSGLEANMGNLAEDSTQGIGHTRWATHGEPSKINAHPHIVENVALIHNGIIENDDILRQDLKNCGDINIISKTDSELVAHLLNIEFKKDPKDKVKIISNVLKKIEGAYALGILFLDDPEHIYAVRKESPLAIGVSLEENIFGSDTNIFPKEFKKAILLENEQFAVISREQVLLYDFSGKLVPIEYAPLHLNDNLADKKGFRHFMLKEIHEQPSVMAKTLNRFTDPDNFFILNHKALLEESLSLKDFTSINIVACGTAYLSGYLTKYLLEPLLNIPINIELASEFRYREPYLDKKSLIITISQSGETADNLASLKYVKEFGCKILSICNNMNSSITRESDFSIPMEAGIEISVASTKAFVAPILCLYMWGLSLADRENKLEKGRLKSILKDLHNLPLYLDRSLSRIHEIEQLSKKYYEFPNFLFIGRGTSFPIAMEGSLKLKELSYIHAEAYAAGELKHGPIALIDRHMPTIVIIPKDKYYPKTLSNIKEIKAREGVVIAIGDIKDKVLQELCDDVIHLPHLDNNAAQAILSTVPVQLFSYFVACKRGTDVDQPRNLAKSVTVE